MIHKLITRRNFSVLFSLWALLLFLATQPSSAQSTTAAISGTVTDSKGGVLQTASIEVKQEPNGNAHSIKSDAQ